MMKNKFDTTFWEAKYTHKLTRWDIGYISTPLKLYFDQLTNKNISILIPGAGNGYEAEYLFTVPPTVFIPPPRVDSGVLRLKRKENFTLPVDEKLFFRVVKTAFQQRRKTLRNSLKSFNLSDNLKANVIFDKRPEQLSVESFLDLTKLVENDENQD